ncbi:MAG: type II secretion system F family protein [Clostridiaceae bacterium]|nr:type II secretion system F family protein [Clostridiaceae bacterium]
MNEYMFKAQNLDGVFHGGKIQCRDEIALNLILRDRGYYLLNYKKVKRYKINGVFNKVSKRDLALMCNQLATILDCGISISEALELLSNQSEKRYIKDSLNEIKKEVEKGEALGTSFEKSKVIYPSIMINMIKIGEESGNLGGIFISQANYFEREDKLIKKIVSSLTYPLLLLILTVLITTILMIKIVPSFSVTLLSLGQKLPRITIIILNLSYFLKNNFLFIVLGIVMVVILVKKYFQSVKGMQIKDGILLKVPLFKKLYIKLVELKFIKAMSILLESGNTVFKSIQFSTFCTENKIIKERLLLSIDEIMKGKSAVSALNRVNIFEPLVMSMIAVGEETGQLSMMLNKASEIIEDDVKREIENLTVLLEPIMIVILAMIIGVVIFSIMMPMFNIMDSIS